MRVPIAAVLGCLAVPCLGMAGCAPSARAPEAACAEHGLQPGTRAFDDCVDLVRDKGAAILRHQHSGGHQ